MVRDYISEHGGEWEEIITAPSFQERFTVGGSALKNVPAGYEKDHPQAEYLKYKSWYLEYPIQDEELTDGDLFLAKAADISCHVWRRPHFVSGDDAHRFFE